MTRLLFGTALLSIAALLAGCTTGGGNCPNNAGSNLGIPQNCGAAGGGGGGGTTLVPAVTNDAATTDEGAPVTIDVNDNDTPGTGSTTVSSVTQPANGTATIDNATTGLVTYTPNTDFSGTDTFTYTFTDSNGAFAVGIVTVTVADLNPVNTRLQDLTAVTSFNTTAAALAGLPAESALLLRTTTETRITIGPLAAPTQDQGIFLGTGGGFFSRDIQFSYTGGFEGFDGLMNYWEINLDSQEIQHGSLAPILIPEAWPHPPFDVDDPATVGFDESDPANAAGLSQHFTRLALLVPGAAASGLSYASYGIWEVEGQNIFGTSYLGAAISFGILTSAGAMPTTGTANYTGTMNGLYSPAQPAGSLFTTQSSLAGDAALTADFAAGTVSADFTNIVASRDFGPFTPRAELTGAGPSGAFVNIHGDATISGNSFSGAAATVAPTGAVLSPDLSGDISGNFFGLVANEIGGVIRLGDPGTGQIVGGFAAGQ